MKTQLQKEYLYFHSLLLLSEGHQGQCIHYHQPTHKRSLVMEINLTTTRINFQLVEPGSQLITCYAWDEDNMSEKWKEPDLTL